MELINPILQANLQAAADAVRDVDAASEAPLDAAERRRREEAEVIRSVMCLSSPELRAACAKYELTPVTDDVESMRDVLFQRLRMIRGW